MTERDTHFASFAKLLWREMLDLNSYGYIDEGDSWIYGDNESPEYERLLAQRAYDLACHVLENQPIIPRNTFPDDSWVIGKIPDLTQWPDPPAPE